MKVFRHFRKSANPNTKVNKTEMNSSLPAPVADLESEFYWSGLKDKKILLQHCRSCEKARFPAMPSCCYCGSELSDVVAASGGGKLYSWVVVHYAFNPAFADEVPYAVAVIELDEGCRLVARLEDHRDLKANSLYESYFVEHSTWTEARFRQLGEA